VNVLLSLFLASLFIPLLSSTLLIAIPVLLADACGGYQPVLVGFGAAWFSGTLLASGLVAFVGTIIEDYGFPALTWGLAILSIVVLVVLLAIGQEVFSVDPPQRGRAIAPVNREPVVTALLACFVPFYLLYWTYKIHGEEAYVKASTQLLSPRAAAWLAAIPVLNILMFPIMLSTLADHHNAVAAECGGGRMQRPWAAFLWAFLLPPIAIGLTQSSFNAVGALRQSSEATTTS
jgi:hypothetical protein